MKILAVYPYFPSKRTRVRSHETLRLLSGIGEVTVAFPTDGTEDDSELDIQGDVISVKDGLPNRAIRVLSAVTRGKSITYSYYGNASDVGLNAGRFDLIFIERLPITDKVAASGKPIIYDAVDSFFVQVPLLAQNAIGLKKLGYCYDTIFIEREQVAICNRATGVLCTTALEQRRLEKAGVVVPVKPFLHSSQITRLSVKPSPESPKHPRAIFHGRASYAANRTAAHLIASKIAPAAPAVDFVIFGAGWEGSNNGRPHVFGFQKDLSLLYTADFALFPLDVAVGIQNKVIEALSAGLPCVVTPVVLDGLPKEVVARFPDRLHVMSIDHIPNFVKETASTLSRSDNAAEAFYEMYSTLVARERTAAENFISTICRN